MIQRFEDEFPDTRLGINQPPESRISEEGAAETSLKRAPTQLGAVRDESTTHQTAIGPAVDADTAIEDEDTDQYAVRISRRSSNTSLHARALMSEEAQLHRFGQHFRRDIISPELENPD